MSLRTDALKVSGVPDAISRREVSMATLERENHPNERPPTGTVTLKYRKIPKISPGAYIF